MPLIATKGEDKPQVPTGTHLGICYMVLDLGIQKTNFEGVDGQAHKCFIAWELPSEKMDDGRPFVISKEYTVSVSPKSNLYADLISWRGREFTPEELNGFDIFNVMGAPAMISVVHKTSKKGSTYSMVGAVSKAMKGLDIPTPANPLVKFSFSDGDAVPEDIYDWLKEKIATRLADNWDEYNEAHGNTRTPPALEVWVANDIDEEIPF